MTRRTRHLAPLAFAALLGCQDYNFSSVDYCLIQPGTERVTLSDISTADILFVVDDSGSMGGEQQKLADSFDAFVKALALTNSARVDAQLEPIDFHIAITTTSVFTNKQTNATCRNDCSGAGGQPFCCPTNGAPLKVQRTCTTLGSTSQCGAGNTCRDTCLGRAGQPYCCAGAGVSPEQVSEACPTLGEACGEIQDRYVVNYSAQLCPGGTGCATGFTCRTDCDGLAGQQACCDASGVRQRVPTCDIGVGTEGALYPRGDFVRAGANPRVLHFTKDLFCTRNAQDTACVDNTQSAARIQTLIDQFGQNTKVGTCGSSQEQPLEATRRAIKKALRQDGLQQPADVAPGEWPHASSKLVVVVVSDEDDCSSAEDPFAGLILVQAQGTPDSCEQDGALPEAQRRRFRLEEYTGFLTSLGRPIAGAFIVSATGNTCSDASCQAAVCQDPTCTEGPLQCGGQAASLRLVDVSKILLDRNADRVVGSICNPGTAEKPGFSAFLERVAEVVKQPPGLQLPTQPASSRISVLRIVDSGGATRKKCVGPAPAGADATARAAFDWWFTSGSDTDFTPTGPSKFLYINRTTRNCEANPGETYSADYLGLMPAGGCADANECSATLGGSPQAWQCCNDVTTGGVCVAPAGSQRGSCLCTGNK